ncbi:hypothetical protein ACQEU8_19675 [Streptomyces sp. CA-250714]|uniref:hypothetical protein n=1 Tax=Streptomyces sp. CA-250714 TaxID=3240060 RepID=UPI003D8BC6D9
MTPEHRRPRRRNIGRHLLHLVRPRGHRILVLSATIAVTSFTYTLRALATDPLKALLPLPVGLLALGAVISCVCEYGHRR